MHRRDREPCPVTPMKRTRPSSRASTAACESPVFAQRELPLDHVDEVVQLDQVDAVDAEPVERAANLLPRSPVVPLAGLRRQEERLGVALQPRRDAQLGVAVRGCGVDVVHAVGEQLLERSIRLRCVTCASAAAPKITRELSWPVRPNGAFAITKSVSLTGTAWPELFSRS